MSRAMIEGACAGRAATPDEVATIGALLMGPDAAFITGSDFLVNGGATASYFFGIPGSRSSAVVASRKLPSIELTRSGAVSIR